MGGDKNLVDLENCSDEETGTLEITQKLRESGLSNLEINFLASFSDNFKRILDDVVGINNLIKISPAYKVKQTLNVVREELNYLKSHIQKLEKAQDEVAKLKNKILQLQSELGAKHQAADNQNQVIDNQNQVIDNLNNQLSNALILNKQLQEQLNSYPKNKTISPEYYTARSKERYYSATERDFEFLETRRENQKLLEEQQQNKKELVELKEELEFTKDKLNKIVREMEEHYKNKIASLRDEVDRTVDKKQKEWEQHYAYLNEQRRIEILTLQRKKEEELLEQRLKMDRKIEEHEELKNSKNPASKLFKEIINKLGELR